MANTHKHPMVRVTVDMTPDMHAALRKQCEEEDFTMAQYIRRLIRVDVERTPANAPTTVERLAERLNMLRSAVEGTGVGVNRTLYVCDDDGQKYYASEIEELEAQLDAKRDPHLLRGKDVAFYDRILKYVDPSDTERLTVLNKFLCMAARAGEQQ
ncbi:hypothetical protein [Burkholderia cepacia]|uniref:hypothetical protein n=1 Tax=Burkholderia cepacia TaxID=292 RepID=UPI000A825A83|nr:hypothetical protein [Burkholderia cepacia]